jgi:transcriptional regulator with GAF, ATPase, and Fis domain
LKFPSADTALNVFTKKSILIESYNYQRKLKSGIILKAARKVHEKGNLFIEYPLLDEARWRLLTPQSFRENYPSILVQMCTAVDYLHLLGLVHGDLKLSNFRVDLSRPAQRVILVDLDFLTAADSPVNARIFGTPEHIAPEILINDRIFPESDGYSLGVSLRACLAAWEQDDGTAGNGGAEPAIDGLAAFCRSLTMKDPGQRPRSLVEGLFQCGIISDEMFAQSQKTLLAIQLMGDFKSERKHLGGERDWLKRFLSERNGVFGFHEELIEELQSCCRSSMAKAFRVFVSLIRGATVNRYGDYWQISLSDSALYKVLASVDRIIKPDHGLSFIDRDRTQGNTERLYRLIGQPLSDRNRLRTFLILKKALVSPDPPLVQETADLLAALYHRLAGLAQELNRANEAGRYLAEALHLASKAAVIDLNLLYDTVYHFIMTNRYQEAGELIAKGLLEAKLRDNQDLRIALNRQRSWILAARGEYDRAEKLLLVLLDRAESGDIKDELLKIHIVLGVLYWRKGIFFQSEKYFMKALRILKQHNLTDNALSLYTNLCLLSFELSEYEKAIKYGELAIESHVTPGDLFRLPVVYGNLALSLIRIGEYKRAAYWLQRYLMGGITGADKGIIRNFYFYQGNLALEMGNLETSRKALVKSLEMFDSDERDKILGKIYHHLALIELYRGNSQDSRGYLNDARAVFRKLNDDASLAEIEFAGRMGIIWPMTCGIPEDVIDILRELIERNCRYYAVKCLFFIMCCGDKRLKAAALAMSEPLTGLIKKSTVPLFKAVAALLPIIDTDEKETAQIIGCLKAAYRIVHASGGKFLALILCLRVSESYLGLANRKLAKRFLSQALEISESLKNEPLKSAISEKVSSSSWNSYDQQDMIKSIHGISKILQNIDNYDVALKELVEYAVELTGAERGVLLLCSKPSPRLHVRSSVNCDYRSLEDIRDFSETIPRHVSEELTPLVIDNALEDRRTRKYESIIAHNILSVICVPIRAGDSSFGVLYLDHHTIPALFDENDVIFVSSVANFISTLLKMIRGFRDIGQVKTQLENDLAKLGAKPPFKTADETMKSLLERLPALARTNASLLLCGESGTGKEILCQMIHDLSPRRNGPLIKLNCAAIPGSMIESELFGVAKSAATGVGEREGKLSAADGGTLFLDEIGDMPLETQAKVLRALEYQEFEKVGSNVTISTDIRFIYATNKDLRQLIKQRKFREDLFYRVNTITIEIPALRERKEDVPLLVDHFLELFSPDRKSRPRFGHDAMRALLSYRWPGNVRELKNLMERCCILFPGKEIGLMDLPREFHELEASDAESAGDARLLEKAKIRELLIAHNWNQSRVSRAMNIPLTTLRRKIKKYRISRNI